MNIAFCYITPFHPQKGGIGRVTDTLTRELQNRGHQIFYLIFESAITIKHKFDYPAPLTYLPSKNLLSKENLDFYHDFLRKNKIDIIVDQGGNFAEYPLWLNTGNPDIKKISVIHTCDTVTYRNLWEDSVFPLRDTTFIAHLKRFARILLYPKIKRDFYKRMTESYAGMMNNTDVVVGLSKRILPEFEVACPGISSKCRSIGNPNSYNPSQIRIKQKKKIILFVGLFGNHKSEDRAALIWKKLFRKYPDWTFNMIGYGSELRTRYLKKIVKGIPNFNLLGFQDTLPYQLEASIACMTSSNEAWGMVLTEAMQCGTVPIAYDSFAAASEIIESGVSGELVKPFDEREYIKKLSRLMDDVEYRNRLSENARQSVKRFDVSNIANKWEDLFKELKE